ncbi:CvpA family protein [Rhodospirillaceae bacterium]|nr:CvpA family protein [Rhodospirillaceae bacterium]
MDILTIDPTDLIILIIIFCFGLFSLFRGFIKELFSIIGWIFAIILATSFTPFVLSKIQVMLPSISLSPLIAGVLIALIVYILFRILGGLFQKKLAKANGSAINRSLGFLLGVAKGFALVCITIFITKTFLNEAEYPKWLRTSKSLPLLESMTMFAASQLPMYLQKNFEKKPIDSFKTETKMKFESLNLPKLKQGYSHKDTAYNENQRLLMDKKFRKITPSQQKLQ